MKQPVQTQAIHSRQRGDTIVEVLISLAVLGSVLGGAYVVSSRNITTNRLSQERLEAVKLAETQFERLRAQAAKENSTVLDETNFCLPKNAPVGSEVVIASADQCKVDANGDPVAADIAPRYNMAIVREQYVNLPGAPPVPKAGTRFRITMTWENVGGRGTDRLDSYYEVYK